MYIIWCLWPFSPAVAVDYVAKDISFLHRLGQLKLMENEGTPCLHKFNPIEIYHPWLFFFVFFTALQCNLSIVRHLLDSLYWVKRIEPSGGDASNESQVHQYYMHVVSLLVIALTSWMRSEMPMMSYRCRVVTPISLVCFVANCLTSANNNGDIYRVTWSCGIL
jgi:hypothetical protein